MNILIPMAGEGKRFSDTGYTVHKPAIPTYSRRTGVEVPMVVAATEDLPHIDAPDTVLTYVNREFHKDDGIEDVILTYYPDAKFITAEKLTEGQACTCLLAKEFIDNDIPLLIAGCDNGMVYDLANFDSLTAQCDALVFTYRHNEAVLMNPKAYGYVTTNADGNATGVSVKVPISDNPMNDHAVVSTFWFKRGSDFVTAAEAMIAVNDRINNEFYVDQVVKYLLRMNLDVRIFEIDRYIGWGTPFDYENYQKTFVYWKTFIKKDKLLRDEWNCR